MSNDPFHRTGERAGGWGLSLSGYHVTDVHSGTGVSSMPTAWSDDHAELGLGDKRSFRPTIMGTNGMVSTGHYLSTLVGVQVLQLGGNAVDAGVAAAMAGCVLQSEMV